MNIRSEIQRPVWKTILEPIADFTGSFVSPPLLTRLSKSRIVMRVTNGFTIKNLV